MPYGTINADKMTTSDGVSSSGLYGFKNRILNGQMVIDQRNAGASVTVTGGSSGYAVDRFRLDSPVGQSITGQQVTASLSGFQNAMTYTAGTASTNASDESEIVQFIEGYNVTDLQFGTANAQTLTLSFWAKSSLTGTFGLILENSARDRQYITSYSLPTANTWTYISKTIVGDTSGTWLYTNGRGIGIRWDMGTGTARSGAVTNAWGVSSSYGITAGAGVVKLTQNTGATFYITGVQLEKGSTATSFDYRPYGTELQLCQRYFQAYTYTQGPCNGWGSIRGTSTGAVMFTHPLRTQMRTTPSEITLPTIGNGANNFTFLSGEGYPATFGSLTTTSATADHVWMNFTGFSSLGSSYQNSWAYSTGTIVFKFGAEL